jgi:hypothetical protein
MHIPSSNVKSCRSCQKQETQPKAQSCRVWSQKVSKGVMQEQEFLVSHPCKMQDSCEKWFLKSCKKYHCKTMQDLIPVKSNRTKGGGLRPSKGGVEPDFWVPATSYRTKTTFLLRTDSAYLCTYILAFLVRPGLGDETQVLREKSRTCLTRSRSKTKLCNHVLSKLVITTPQRALCVDLIKQYTLKGKENTSINYMCLAMIDPATSWFDTIKLPTVTSLTVPSTGKGKKATYILT